MGFNPGITFSDTDAAYTLTASADTLHALVASGTASGVTAGEHADSALSIFRTADRPPEAETQLRSFWWDETNEYFKIRSASDKFHNWLERYDAENDGDEIAPRGGVLINMGGYAVGLSTMQGDPLVVGVAAFTLPTLVADSIDEVAKFGIWEVQAKGPFKPGDLLVTSTFKGFAQSSTVFADNHNFTAGVAFGQFLFSAGSGFSGLTTCLLTL